MCRGSRVRTETTMDNTLQFTHDPYLEPNQEPHGVTLVKLDAFSSLSTFFWKSDLAKPGTNEVRQRYCCLPLGGSNNKYPFLAQRHRRTGAESSNLQCDNATLERGEISFLWLCLLNKLAPKVCHTVEQLNPLGLTAGSPQCPAVRGSPHCSFHMHRRTALWSF